MQYFLCLQLHTSTSCATKHKHRPKQLKECSIFVLHVLLTNRLARYSNSDSPLHSLEGLHQVLSLACPLQYRCHQREQSGAQWLCHPEERGMKTSYLTIQTCMNTNRTTVKLATSSLQIVSSSSPPHPLWHTPVQ